jgi:hypothetical protein
MSILPNQTNKNDNSFFFATEGGGGGGGVIPQLLNSLISENIYNFEDAGAETVITPLGASINQPVSGNVLVTVNMNIYGNGNNQNYVIPITIERNGDPYYFTDLPRASSYGNTSYSFNISIPYVQGDTDEYYYRFLIQSTTDITVRTSCSFVFYPNIST